MDKRRILMEHQVYRLLGARGVAVPQWELLPLAPPVDTTGRAREEELLNRFNGAAVVLKIAAAHIAHKSSVGGVLFPHSDSPSVAAAVATLRQRFAAEEPAPAGILVVERIAFSTRIGEEVLLNGRYTTEFGLVFSVAPGGEDAESLARTVTPPRVAASPEELPAVLRESWLAELWGRRDGGTAEPRIAGITACAVALQELMETEGLDEVEVNPLVWTDRGALVALDGLAYAATGTDAAGPDAAAPDAAAPDAPAPPPGDTHGLDALLRPRSVAVVGVSATDLTRPGSIIAANLARTPMVLWCINPRGGEVDLQEGPRESRGSGVPRTLYRDIASLPEVPDLAVITVPAAAALAAVEDAARCGVSAAVIIPGGFSELTGDTRVEDRIAAIARESRMRIVGPNCLGVLHGSLNTFFIPPQKVPVGEAPRRNLMVVSQSGALALVVLANLRETVDPHTVVSYGNGVDVDPADLVTWAAHQDEIHVVAVYVEGFSPGGGRRLLEAISHAVQAGKTVVCYKAGRTAAGHDATASHTASMSGSYHVASSLLRAAGAIVADRVETFILLAGFFSALSPWAGPRERPLALALVGNAGYEKAAAADHIDDTVLVTAALDEEARRRFRGLLPPFVSVSALLDVTPMADDSLYAAALDECLSLPTVDAVLVSIVPHSPAITTTDDEIAAGSSLAAELIAVAQRHKKPVVCSLTVEGGTGSRYNTLRRDLARGGIAVTTHSDDAITALGWWSAAMMNHRDFSRGKPVC